MTDSRRTAANILERGKRFVVHADEELTAFLKLESAVCASGELV